MKVNYSLKTLKFRNWEMVYTVALVFYVITGMLMSSLVGKFELPESARLVRFGISFFLLCLSIGIKGYFRNIVSLVLASAVFALTILSSGSIRELMILLVFMIASEDVDFDKVFKVLAISMLAFIILIILCDKAGLFAGYYSLIENVDRNVEGERVTRDYLGFDYPTMGPSLFITVVYLDGFVNRKRDLSVNELAKYVIILVLNYILKVRTDTRGVYYCVLLFVAGMLCIKCSKLIRTRFLKNRLFRVLVIAAFIGLILISLYIGYNYSDGSAFYRALNAKLSNRLLLTRDAIKEFGIHLFGSKFEWRLYGYRGTPDYMFVDCSYWNIIIKNGIVIFLLMTAILLIIMKFLMDTNDIVTAWIFMVIMVRAMIDPQLMNIIFTPFILLIGNAIRYYYIHSDILSVAKRRIRKRELMNSEVH